MCRRLSDFKHLVRFQIPVLIEGVDSCTLRNLQHMLVLS